MSPVVGPPPAATGWARGGPGREGTGEAPELGELGLVEPEGLGDLVADLDPLELWPELPGLLVELAADGGEQVTDPLARLLAQAVELLGEQLPDACQAVDQLGGRHAGRL